MKYLKPHFWYSKSQRNGVFFLILIIVILQMIYLFADFTSDIAIDVNKEELLAFQNRIDSLKEIEVEKRKPKIYPFNPNFITDYKGYQLGMSIEEIDRLHQFRKQNKFVNSVKEFKQVTKVSDSLLNVISPYFKFPDWVVKRNRLLQEKKRKEKIFSTTITELEVKEIQKININTASFKEVLVIPYIDYNLCKKIFEYRDEVAELQDISELKNIEGFPLEKYDRIVLYLEAK